MRLWAGTWAWVTLDPKKTPLLLDFGITCKPSVTTQLAYGLLATALRQRSNPGELQRDRYWLLSQGQLPTLLCSYVRGFVLRLCLDLVRFLPPRGRRQGTALRGNATLGTQHAACTRWHLSEGLLHLHPLIGKKVSPV